MKKILFILGLASLLVTGCGDFFDTAPSNKIPTAIAFRTVTDVDNAVNGLYDLMSASRIRKRQVRPIHPSARRIHRCGKRRRNRLGVGG